MERTNPISNGSDFRSYSHPLPHLFGAQLSGGDRFFPASTVDATGARFDHALKVRPGRLAIHFHHTRLVDVTDCSRNAAVDGGGLGGGGCLGGGLIYIYRSEKQLDLFGSICGISVMGGCYLSRLK